MYCEIESRFNMKAIVFDDESLTVGDKVYPYSTIEKLEVTSAPLFSTYGIMTLRADGRDVTVPFPRSAAGKLRRAIQEYEHLRDIAAQTSGVHPDPSGSAAYKMDPYEEAKKLKELLDLGIITQEEFERKKKEILNL